MTKQPTRSKVPGAIHIRIAELRERRKLTQEQLASACGVDKTAVSHWETGHSAPRASRMGKVAKALGVKAGELLGLLAGAV